MVRKTNGVAVLLVAILLLGTSTIAEAAFYGLPKSIKAPLDHLELSVPIWGPQAYSLYCVEHIEECQPKKASLFGMPKALKPQLDRIQPDAPALAPMAHSVFCVRYPQECEVKRIAFRGRAFELTPRRWNDLVEINAKVNRSIAPERNLRGLAGEKWVIAPKSGDCNDYAVTKRHELLARGWPSRKLLLAEVLVHGGQHHLVLVARTGDGDFVLDSLNPDVRIWSKVSYRWLRIQSTLNPKWWSSVRSRDV